MSSETSTSTFQPWQFFVLAALGCATALTFLVRDRGIMALVLLTLIMGTTVLVGLAALRAVRPLVSPNDDRSMVIGQRTRAGLEQEKALALRTIKELEFDRAMGKISEEDFKEMSVRLRARAARLMRQLDAGAGYRAQIEHDLARRLGDSGEKATPAAHACPKCSTANDADARFCKSCGRAAVRFRGSRGWMSATGRNRRQGGTIGAILCALAVMWCGAFLQAQFQMPDPKQMSGIPRPVDDLPNGSLSVRLIKGELSNNIVNHPVELHVGDRVQTVNTDEGGRAQFDNLPAGATIKAVAVVDGERLESQEFPAPVQGGIRLMLVATDAEKERQKAAEAAAPAISGQVVLGGESRIVIEPADESLSIYYLLDIVNGARAPVNPPAPFVFDMPKGTVGTAVLQGSSPLATSNGVHITVVGPFPPGTTSVQVAGSLPVTSGTLEISQTFPATFEQLVLVAKKEGEMKLASPQIERQQETPMEGATVIVGAGGSLAAGHPLSVTLSGLVHHSAIGRRVALGTSAFILLAGVWAAWGPNDPKTRTDERKRLIARREKLLQDLVRLENDLRRNRIDKPRYDSRREELFAALEHIYGALDSDETSPEPAGRTGLAA